MEKNSNDGQPDPKSKEFDTVGQDGASNSIPAGTR